jgi:hypothetical protein
MMQRAPTPFILDPRCVRLVPILGRKQTINRKMKNDRQIPKTLAGALGGEQIGNVIAVSIREKGITARLVKASRS